jgi:hypothetical protein
MTAKLLNQTTPKPKQDQQLVWYGYGERNGFLSIDCAIANMSELLKVNFSPISI